MANQRGTSQGKNDGMDSQKGKQGQSGQNPTGQGQAGKQGAGQGQASKQGAGKQGAGKQSQSEQAPQYGESNRSEGRTETGKQTGSDFDKSDMDGRSDY